MNRYCFALDLIDDKKLIAEYEQQHRQVWPEVLQSLQNAGIFVLDIYRAGNRLFMIMETAPHFSFEKKQAEDAANERVQAWEKLMWNYQQALPFASPGEKWVMMEPIFSLNQAAGL